MDPRFPATPTDHQTRARLLVAQYINRKDQVHLDRTGVDELELEDVYIVSFTYILGSWKAIISTTIPDQRIYEVTYNSKEAETYVNVYQKIDDTLVPN